MAGGCELQVELQSGRVPRSWFLVYTELPLHSRSVVSCLFGGRTAREVGFLVKWLTRSHYAVRFRGDP
jgi:hypothetical protein